MIKKFRQRKKKRKELGAIIESEQFFAYNGKHYIDAIIRARYVDGI